jgi:hypothetical protein
VTLEGRAQGVAGGCPNLQFQVNGTAVTTDGSTSFKGGNCRHLENNMRVTVRGLRAGAVVRASDVDLDRRDDDDDDLF